MANTSRNPFPSSSAVAPMATRTGGRKKAGTSAAATTPKKAKKSTKRKKTVDPDDLSDLDATSLDLRKAPQEYYAIVGATHTAKCASVN